jgi:hypothetical protein
MRFIKKIGMSLWQLLLWGYLLVIVLGIPVVILKFIFG